jgi:hypothetical protein
MQEIVMYEAARVYKCKKFSIRPAAKLLRVLSSCVHSRLQVIQMSKDLKTVTARQRKQMSKKPERCVNEGFLFLE